MRKMRNQVSIIIALLSVWWSRVGGSRNWTSSTTLYSLNWSGDPDHSYRTQLPEASPGMSPATPAATYWSSSSTQPPPPQVSSHNSPDVPVIETDQPPPLQVSSHNSPDVSSIVTDQAIPPQVSSHDSQDVSSIVTDEPPLPQVSSHKLRGVPAIVTDQPPPLQVSTYNSPDVPSIVTDQPPPPQELPHYSHDVSGIVTQQLPAPQASLHDLQDVFGIVSSSQGVAWPSPSSPLPTMTSPAHHVFSSPSPAAGGDHPPHILSLLKQNNLSKSSQSPLHPTDHSAGSSLPVSTSSTWSGVWPAPQGCLPPLTAAGGNYMVTLRPHSSTFQYAVALTHIPRLTHFTVCLRFQLSSLANPHFLLSYATRNQDNAIVIFVSPAIKPGIGFYVNNVRIKAATHLKVDWWHNMCAIWSGHRGRYFLYLDGKLIKKGRNKCRGCEVRGGGVAVLGLEQDNQGGGFNHGQVTHGHLTHLHVWPSALSYRQLLPHFVCCKASLAFQDNLVCNRTSPSGSCGTHSDQLLKAPTAEGRVIAWGRTPLALMGGALLLPLQS